jgi:DNA-binding GntR family transcriptional regulator
MAYRSLAVRSHLEQSCRYHREILNAIKDKDAARAEALTREHTLKGLAAQENLSRDDSREFSFPTGFKEAQHAVTRG